MIDTNLQKELDSLINEVKTNYLFCFSRYLNKVLVPPDMIQIMLTSRCNLQCKMCSVWKNKHNFKEELTTQQLKDLIDRAIDMGIATIYFTGGEALLREDIFELIDYAARDNIITTFNTNGSLITKDIAHRIAYSKLRSLTFSIDSPNEEIHDSLRGKGVFNKAMQAIGWINECKQETGRPDLVMCSVVMRQNIADLEALVDLAERNHFCYLALQPIVDNSGLWQQPQEWKNAFWINHDDLPKLQASLERLEQLKKEKEKKNFTINVMAEKTLDYFRSGLRVNTCFAGFSRVFVNQLGDISFICFESFGNIKRDKLKDVWYGDKSNRLRKKIKECASNCTQFCSERPESENLEIVHRNFVNTIFSRFFNRNCRLDNELCEILLIKEIGFLQDFLSKRQGDSNLEDEIGKIISESQMLIGTKTQISP